MFGPVRRVPAYATIVEPERVRTATARPFTLGGARLRRRAARARGRRRRAADGELLRRPHRKQRGLEFHGDDGSLYLATWDEFDSPRRAAGATASAYETVPPLREPYHGIDWSRALSDLAAAIAEDRPHRAGGEHAAHLVEVLEAVQTSLARRCGASTSGPSSPARAARLGAVSSEPRRDALVGRA